MNDSQGNCPKDHKVVWVMRSQYRARAGLRVPLDIPLQCGVALLSGLTKQVTWLARPA
jgi:hypothetical protein